jgi:hypothetical protein
MTRIHKKSAINTFELFLNNPSESLVIHYSRQNLEDNESGMATPRVIAIIVKSLDGKLSECFAIHHEAEKAKIVWDEITNYYDFLEERLIKGFVTFVKTHRNYNWLHWDMNDVHFSFEAIEHRYKVLVDENGKDFVNIPLDKRVNLNQLLKQIYGDNYENEPQFDNLLKSNNNGVLKNGYLTLSQEANAFKDLNFSKILESLRCKVNFLLEIINKTPSKQLKVSNRNIINRLGSFITHPITASIAFAISILGVLLTIYSLF